VYALGWAADYPDENNWVLEVFHPTMSRNVPQWTGEDPAAEPELARRKERCFEAEKILCWDEAVIAPLFHSPVVRLAKPDL